jgi:hypothetical protein
MFEGWENFYLIVGPSAAALIGLMFVVVTLSTSRDPDQTEWGKHLYTSPIVYHLTVVVLFSCAAMVPGIPRLLVGGVTGIAALGGLAFGIRSTIGIARRQPTGEDSLFDMWWYGVAPTAGYLGLGASATSLLLGKWWADDLLGATLVSLLLISIHAEWDLVTFLAPRATK